MSDSTPKPTPVKNPALSVQKKAPNPYSVASRVDAETRSALYLLTR